MAVAQQYDQLFKLLIIGDSGIDLFYISVSIIVCATCIMFLLTSNLSDNLTCPALPAK